MKAQSVTPELMVTDMDRTIYFYARELGFQLQAAEKDHGEVVWAQIELAENRLISFKEARKLKTELPLFDGVPIGGTFTLCIQIESVLAFKASLPDSVPIVEKLHKTSCHLNQFSIKDPDGYILTFIDIGKTE